MKELIKCAKKWMMSVNGVIVIALVIAVATLKLLDNSPVYMTFGLLALMTGVLLALMMSADLGEYIVGTAIVLAALTLSVMVSGFVDAPSELWWLATLVTFVGAPLAALYGAAVVLGVETRPSEVATS